MDTLPAPFRVIARALITWWDAAISLAILNLVWCLSWITIILGPPATFGLYYVVNELVHGRDVGLMGIFTGVRLYFWQSWLWMLPNILIIAIIATGSPFLEIHSVFVPLVAITTALWLLIQFYSLPYFIEQESKNLFIAWRNGLFTALASPIFTLLIFTFTAVLVGISVLLVAPLFIGGICLIALVGTVAVFDRLESFGLRHR